MVRRRLWSFSTTLWWATTPRIGRWFSLRWKNRSSNGRRSTTIVSEEKGMRTEEVELAPVLARRELWLLISTAYLDPYHRERFALLRDAEYRQRAIRAAGLLAEEHPAIE